MKKTIVALLLITGLTNFSQAQDQMPPKPPSVEDRIKHLNDALQKNLTITKDQQQKIDAIYKDFFVKMDKLHVPPPPPPPPADEKGKPSRAEVEKICKERDDQIQKILDAGQYTKYREVEKSLKPPPPPVPASPVKK